MLNLSTFLFEYWPASAKGYLFIPIQPHSIWFWLSKVKKFIVAV